MSRLPTKLSLIDYACVGLWIAGLFILLFHAEQSDFVVVGTGYVMAFAAYFWLIKYPYDHRALTSFVLLGVVARVVAIFVFPLLSDDIYRFVWDGRLAVAGYNPFDHLPRYYLEAGNDVKGITQDLFNQLNSPDYFTIYPTISQWVFKVAAWISPDSIYGFSVVLKGFLAVLDIGSIWLIYRILHLLDKDITKIKWYALNPLVIVEISGNAHFEGAMIFFLLLALYLVLIHQEVWSAVALSAAVASKMIPLIFLPLVLAIMPWKKAIKYLSVTGVSTIILSIPLLISWDQLSQSIGLYFQKFEFNASIYYIVRWIGFQVKGWNIIADAGPVLGLVVFTTIWIFTFFNCKSKLNDWPRLMLWALLIYLLMATTVHPWYITTLVALATLCRFRFVLLWSGLITLTYLHYSYDPWFENLWVVAFEYILFIGVMIFELRQSHLKPSLVELNNQSNPAT